MPTIIFLLLFSFASGCYANWFSSSNQTNTVIVINPSGDAAHAGRIIEDSFERGITLQIAEYLKLALEERNPYLTVLLTRMPGEVIEPLYNAQYTNRISPFLYISLHCYEERKPIPQLYIYTFSLGNDFVTPTTNLSLYTYDNAYLLHKKNSHLWANKFYEHVSSDSYKRLCSAQKVMSVPFAPLMGISAPSFALEIGLAKKKDWIMIKQALILGIESIINSTISIR
jgi:N-acetylmuramoyl-L-alanine amidase